MQENWQFLVTMSVSATITTRFQIMSAAAVDVSKTPTAQTAAAALKAPQVNPPVAVRPVGEVVWLRPFPALPANAAIRTATASDYAPLASALH